MTSQRNPTIRKFVEEVFHFVHEFDPTTPRVPPAIASRRGFKRESSLLNKVLDDNLSRANGRTYITYITYTHLTR